MDTIIRDAKRESGSDCMEAAEKKLTKEQEGMRDAICQIRGVLYAHLVFDAQGALQEIHVVSNTLRAPKQVARDIESLLLARFELRVDHKIISVAQMEEKELFFNSLSL